jgi:hypothetical protein
MERKKWWRSKEEAKVSLRKKERGSQKTEFKICKKQNIQYPFHHTKYGKIVGHVTKI